MLKKIRIHDFLQLIFHVSIKGCKEVTRYFIFMHAVNTFDKKEGFARTTCSTIE